MSLSINKVLLGGNIASDITSNKTAAGMTVANFRLAVNTHVSSGEPKAMFIDVAVFGVQAENTMKYCGKGSAVLVDGRIDEDTWTTPEGSKRFKHFVTAREITFLTFKAPVKGTENDI